MRHRKLETGEVPKEGWPGYDQNRRGQKNKPEQQPEKFPAPGPTQWLGRCEVHVLIMAMDFAASSLAVARGRGIHAARHQAAYHFCFDTPARRECYSRHTKL